MAQKTGRLVISPQDISSLNGTRLAIRGAGNPLRDATSHIRNSGFNHNSFITATGDDGFLGNIPVFFFTNIAPAVVESPVSALNFEIAAESDAPLDETPRHSRSDEKISENTDLKRRERRRKRNVIVIAGGAALVAVVALLILSRKNDEDR